MQTCATRRSHGDLDALGRGVADVTVVVRAAGERTELACRALIGEQFPPEQIVTVRNAPFSAALADSYRAGLHRGRAWTLCVDADVLVVSGVVGQLLDVAAGFAGNICEIQGRILDKFLGVRRPGGIHLYRTCLLEKALAAIPDEGRDIRPEHFALNALAKDGHPWIQVPMLVGVHDFEQFHRDVFRKCYVHGRKHAEQMHWLVAYWRRMSGQDEDFRTALWGLAAGIADGAEARVDVRRDFGFGRWAEAGRVREKGPLDVTGVLGGAVDRIIEQWLSPGPELEQYWSCSSREIVHDGRPPAAASRARKSRGPMGFVPWMMGRLLCRAGRKLERLGAR